MNRAVLLAAALLATTAVAKSENGAISIGNIAVRYYFSNLISTGENPLKANITGPIWCEAQLNGTSESLPILNSTFLRYKDSQRRQFLPEIDYKNNRASLLVNELVYDRMGKYRCEITANNSGVLHIVHGNLYVNSAPFFHTNLSMNMHMVNGSNLVKADKLSAIVGADFDIYCPAVGFPAPNITWFRDGTLIEPNERFLIRDNDTRLTIVKVTPEDAATYRCTAVNEFAHNENKGITERPTRHEASLEQELEIGKVLHLWLIPLFIILLVAIFCCIYACVACGRYRHDDYNVSKREKELGSPGASASSSSHSTKMFEQTV